MLIIVVENSRVGLRIISGMLRDLGHEVMTFFDGGDALECLRSNSHINLLMTSFEIPTVSGLELCWEARLLAGEARALYVIAMSSTYDGKTLGKALDSGADDFIMKPLDPKHLSARLRAAERTVSAQQQLISWASRDPLTDLLNRRAFFKQSSEALESAMQASKPIAAMIIDIDHFKRINDTYGHDVGDDVICGVAAQVSISGGLSVRLGGEEFALLLEGQTPDNAFECAEDLRLKVLALQFPVSLGLVNVTVSIGLAMARPDDTIPELMKRADRALYDAKRAGRNRVVLDRGNEFAEHTCEIVDMQGNEAA